MIRRDYKAVRSLRPLLLRASMLPISSTPREVGTVVILQCHAITMADCLMLCVLASIVIF